MTQEENTLLDNMYFISSFDELKEMSQLDEQKIKDVLKAMILKEWVSVYEDPSGDPLTGLINFEEGFRNYFYLSTKKGMMAHHGMA